VTQRSAPLDKVNGAVHVSGFVAETMHDRATITGGDWWDGFHSWVNCVVAPLESSSTSTRTNTPIANLVDAAVTRPRGRYVYKDHYIHRYSSPHHLQPPVIPPFMGSTISTINQWFSYASVDFVSNDSNQ
jgi:hypothetical protein